MTQPLRLCFMGTPDFAVPTLQALLDAGHQVACVYSQPPRPSGRGHKVTPSPVHQLAASHGIPVRTPLSLKTPEEQQSFQDLQVDLCVVVAYGLILPQSIIDAPRLGTINVHASLLPRWRGAAPIQRSIQMGDAETGVTIMRVELKLDAGPMLMMTKIPITDHTNAADLHDQLAALGAEMIVPAVEGLQNGTLTDTIQPAQGVTYAAKLEKDEGHIDWTQDAATIDRHIRALNPWPGVWFTFNGERFKVLAAQISDGKGPPGQVIQSPLVVACGHQSLALTRLQRAGKAPMGADELLRGFAIPLGSIFA